MSENQIISVVKDGVTQKLPAEATKEGPVVAYQFPDKYEFSKEVVPATKLEEDYGHLTRIDPDDKEAYKALTSAIKVVSKSRTTCTKEENTAKKPLNEFRDLIIKTGRSIRDKITTFEDKLKAEKQRIDDIKQERLLAQQKLWMDNFSKIRHQWTIDHSHGIDKLKNMLESIDEFDIDEFDLGDYEEEAKAEIANKKMALETAIAQKEQAEKERIEREAKEAELKRQQEELAAQKLKQDIINAEIEAYAEDSERRLKAMQAKLEAMQQTEFEKNIKPDIDSIETGCKEYTIVRRPFLSGGRNQGKTNQVEGFNETFNRVMSEPDSKPIPEVIGVITNPRNDDETVSVSTSGTFEDEEEVTQLNGSEYDPFATDGEEKTDTEAIPSSFDEEVLLMSFIESIQDTIDSAPGAKDFIDPNYIDGISRVNESMKKAVLFLENLKKS